MLAGIGFVAMPFVMTSRAREERGITIPARVYHKSEYIRMSYSGWERLRDATIEYTSPENGSVFFFDIYPEEKQYDAVHVNQAVEVRYLLHRDVPDVPMAKFLWEIHALPTVRFVSAGSVSKLNSSLTPGLVMAGQVAGFLAALFIVWRITRWRPLAWATGIGVAAGIGILFWQEFPRPTPAPVGEVRRVSAHVKSVHLIDKLFQAKRTRGFLADQPVQVVGLEFVPEGMTEPVVAVDLIDRGSVPGLKEQATAPVQYEARFPRRAHIDGAARTFPKRNLSGVVRDGALSLALLAGAIAITYWIGRRYKRAVSQAL
jgi:hypothetical protein